MNVRPHSGINQEPSKSFKVRRIFYSSQNIRIVWSILIFLVIFIFLDWVSSILLNRIDWLSIKRPVQPSVALCREFSALLVVLCSTWLMSLIEHRNMASFGYRDNTKIIGVLTGALLGFLSLSVLIGVMWKFGFLIIDGFSLYGADILTYALVWGIIFLMIGFIEESIFRGYLQHTLARGVGFWPAALIVSGGFILWHVSNKGESTLGLLTTGAGSLAFSLSLYYTKSLWWAIGFHTGWDWGQSFFYGTPDSGIVTKEHLLKTHPAGSTLWSGGIVGPEGSAFLFPVLLLVIFAMWFWWSRYKLPQKSPAQG